MSSAGYTSGTVLDIDMTKTSTTSSGASEESSIIATNSTIIIPLYAAIQGKATYVIYRTHDYGSGVVADASTTTENSYHEKIVVNSDKTRKRAILRYEQ